MVEKLKFCVDNEWKDSQAKEYMPVTDSSTGEKIAEAPCCTPEEVNEAVESARKAFESWSETPVFKRAQLMFKFKELVDKHLEELTLILAKEQGKNLDEARGDVIKANEVVEFACSMPYSMQGSSLMQVSRGHDCVMEREPVGVFVGIPPYNFPAMIPFGWMIPLCITAGNTMVLKAANQVPQTAMRMLELLIEAGLPEGVVNLVTCSNNEAELLVKHPDIEGVTYVGSTKVGRHVYQTAAAHGKRIQALCEAKNHGLVLSDAHLERVTRGIINSSLGCAGQRCMALPVLVVEDAVADKFVSMLVEYAKELKVGCAYHPDTNLGPVVTEEHEKYVADWIAKGVEEGADLILDGRNVSVPNFENGFFIGPTIFDNVTSEMSIGNEEVFGPVVCIKRVKNFEEGLELINSSKLGNGSSIFTQNGYYAREFARRNQAGMIGINVGIPVPTAVFPFSGHKDSFFGDLHVMGRDGINFYTQAKLVTTRWFSEEDIKDTKVGTWEGTISR